MPARVRPPLASPARVRPPLAPADLFRPGVQPAVFSLAVAGIGEGAAGDRQLLDQLLVLARRSPAMRHPLHVGNAVVLESLTATDLVIGIDAVYERTGHVAAVWLGAAGFPRAVATHLIRNARRSSLGFASGPIPRAWRTFDRDEPVEAPPQPPHSPLTGDALGTPGTEDSLQPPGTEDSLQLPELQVGDLAPPFVAEALGTVLRLHVAVLQMRTPAQWAALRAYQRTGHRQTAAAELDISPQALGKTLRRAQHDATDRTAVALAALTIARWS